MHDEQIELKAESPQFRCVKESIRSALLPFARLPDAYF